MPTISCQNCGQFLLVPDDKIGRLVRCPKCRVKFKLREKAPAAKEDDGGRQEEGTVQDEAVSANYENQTEVEPKDSEPDFRSAVAVILKKVGGLFDIKFERYLTPWIIRFTWICVLFLAVIWLLFLAGGAIGDMLAGEKEPAESIESMDINDLLSGGTDLTSLLQPNDDRSWFHKTASQFVWITTGIVTLVLTLMWARVTLEVLIVIFNISKTLESIEEKVDQDKTDHGP